MQARSAGHNVTHVNGDKVKVLKEFKVSNSVLVEGHIHKKLNSLLITGEKEFFMCPFHLLEQVISLLVDNDCEENDMVNKIIDAVFALKEFEFNPASWTLGLDLNKLFEISGEMNLLNEHGTPCAAFDVSTASEEEKSQFVSECLKAYERTIKHSETREVSWNEFKKYIISELKIPSYLFKAGDWTPIVKKHASREGVIVKWRKRG